MEIFLFSRPDAAHGDERLKRLAGELDARFPGTWRANREFAAKLGRERDAWDEIAPGEGHVAVSYGGDGTFLECVRMAGATGVPVLGINSGRLGFLANVPEQDMAAAFDDLRSGRYETECRAALHVDGDFPERPSYPFAFNEFSVQRGGGGMIAVEIRVDDQLVATCWGDGVMLSTPSGSTAYNLSVGGPVLAPGCDCFVISPIAPHNLSMRPVVIPGGSKVMFRVLARDGKPSVTLDNQTFEITDSARFTLERSKDPIRLIRLHELSFYDTLRNKLMWGLDRRDETKTEKLP